MILGYLVVLAARRSRKSPRNPSYRGIDRMPPFDRSLWEQGVDWPTLSRDYVDENLLSKDQVLAWALLDRFAAIYPREDLEVLYIRSLSPQSLVPLEATPDRLGFDVAGTAPYYSVVGDPPGTDAATPFLRRLNENGLFSSAADAQAYLEALKRNGAVEPDWVVKIWDLRQVTIQMVSSPD